MVVVVFSTGRIGMSQAGGSSATVKSFENIGPEAPAVAGGWRDSILVLAKVLAPIWTGDTPDGYQRFRHSRPANSARCGCRTANKSEPSGIWTAVLRGWDVAARLLRRGEYANSEW